MQSNQAEERAITEAKRVALLESIHPSPPRILMLELTRPLIVFDLETTGVDVEADRIIEIATMKLQPDHTAEEKVRRLNPGVPIPAGATEVHGITDADVRGMPTFNAVARSMADYFDGCDVAGYNAAGFDVPMLSAHFARARIEWPAADVSVVDPYEIYRRTTDFYTLQGAVRHYTGKDHDGAHEAQADVRAAFAVLNAQVDDVSMARGLPEVNLTVAELDAMGRDPSWIDRRGKFKWLDGVPVVGFGKHQNKPMGKVPRDYWEWMLRQNFSADVVGIVRGAVEKDYPVQP